MTDCGRGGKPKGRFSTAPTALGNRKQRDSHIPTAATKQWKSGKPKAGFPLSHSSASLIYFPIRKEAWRRIASLPPPGSFLDENMLQLRLRLARTERTPISGPPRECFLPDELQVDLNLARIAHECPRQRSVQVLRNQ